MNDQLLIFGTGKIAQIAAVLLAKDYCITAFVVDPEFMALAPPMDRPVIGFGEIAERYGPNEHWMFIALGYHNLNSLRAARYDAARALGYQFTSYVSPRADIGAGAVIGGNCLVMGNASLQPFSSIDDGCFVWNNAVVGHHARIGRHCWITSGAVIGGSVDMRERCFLGANATIAHEIKMGDQCFIGAGALVNVDAAPKGVFVAPGADRLRLNSDMFLKITKMR